MEAIFSSEKIVDFQRTTRRYILEDSTLHNHRSENLSPTRTLMMHSLTSFVLFFNVNPNAAYSSKEQWEIPFISQTTGITAVKYNMEVTERKLISTSCRFFLCHTGWYSAFHDIVGRPLILSFYIFVPDAIESRYWEHCWINHERKTWS
jgi:hypothetical protein